MNQPLFSAMRLFITVESHSFSPTPLQKKIQDGNPSGKIKKKVDSMKKLLYATLQQMINDFHSFFLDEIIENIFLNKMMLLKLLKRCSKKLNFCLSELALKQ